MKTTQKQFFLNRAASKAQFRAVRTACAARLLPLLLLLTLPAVVNAQFNYTTNSGTITITGYTGPGGTVTIPDTTNGLPVTSIGSFAFQYCSLTSVTIGTNVTSIGSSAFSSCYSLTNVTTPNSVTSIGDGAFSYCTSLRSVTIPNSVTSIGSYAFSSCSSLTSVTIPNSVTGIGSSAFAYCTGLTSVTIGNSVTNIGDGAFQFCNGLTNVTIPNSVITIGFAAFAVGTNLAAITVATNNPVYSSVDGVLFDKSQTTLIQCPGGKSASYTVPNSVSTIGADAFWSCTSLTNITIPNGVTNIGSEAFAYCWSLSSVTIPESVTSIGSEAFTVGTSLAAITVATNNPVYSSVDGVLFDKSQTTLLACPGREAGSYTIPSSVTCIGSGAFEYCKSLTNVTIPNSVTNIGDGAFVVNTTLAAITVATNNPVYSNVEGVLFNKSQTTLIQYPGGKSGSYTVPNSVRIIGADAFWGCRCLTSVTIPKSVTSIRDEAFCGCSTLTGIFFQGNAPSLGSFVFLLDNYATVYYLPGTTGWGTTFGGRPTRLWNPQVKTSDASFGVLTNQFGFTITGNTNLVIVVEACTDLANPIWSPVGTNTLTGGSSYFSDPKWTNCPARFYRLRSP